VRDPYERCGRKDCDKQRWNHWGHAFVEPVPAPQPPADAATCKPCAAKRTERDEALLATLPTPAGPPVTGEAIERRCSKCNRASWTNIDGACAFPQPDGSVCTGTWRPVTGDGDEAVVREIVKEWTAKTWVRSMGRRGAIEEIARQAYAAGARRDAAKATGQADPDAIAELARPAWESLGGLQCDEIWEALKQAVAAGIARGRALGARDALTSERATDRCARPECGLERYDAAHSDGSWVGNHIFKEPK
jgi:hypothetical protein